MSHEARTGFSFETVDGIPHVVGACAEDSACPWHTNPEPSLAVQTSDAEYFEMAQLAEIHARHQEAHVV